MKTEYFKKPFVAVIIVIMICILMLAVLVLNDCLPGISGLFQKDLNNAIFNRDGIVYKYDSETGIISSIGNTGLPKYGPVLSPDGTRIAYRNAVFDTPDSALQVGIMDRHGKILQVITIQSPYSNDILNLEWLGNNKIAVTGHVNPSTNECFIFDAKTGKELNRYAGYAFTPLPDESGVIYAENIPHGFGHLAYHSLMINEEVVFTAKNMGSTFGTIAFSKNGRNVAFILRPPQDGNLPSKIVVAEYNRKNHAIKQLYEVDIPENTGGMLAFDEHGNMCIVEETIKHTFSREDGKFTSTEVELVSTRYEKLQNAVLKYFGGNPVEEIFDITWMR